jgi:hypothetical protein
MEASISAAPVEADDLGDERDLVQRHLEERFPEADPHWVAQVIEDATGATAGARIQSYRSLLVEHRASDMIRSSLSASRVETGEEQGPPKPSVRRSPPGSSPAETGIVAS